MGGRRVGWVNGRGEEGRRARETHDAVKVALVHAGEHLARLLRVADVLERLGRVLAWEGGSNGRGEGGSRELAALEAQAASPQGTRAEGAQVRTSLGYDDLVACEPWQQESRRGRSARTERASPECDGGPELRARAASSSRIEEARARDEGRRTDLPGARP